jgi:predicted membrane protein
MDFLELILRFGLALGIGLFFSAWNEGWRARGEPSGARAAGIRTFAISGLLGGVIGALGKALSGLAGGVLMGLGFAAYSAGAAAFFLQENRSQKTYSATTWVVAILTFALGMYSVLGIGARPRHWRSLRRCYWRSVNPCTAGSRS